MLAFYMPLISYLHVVVVLVCLFVLLQFGRLGFWNRDWNNIIHGGGLLLASFFVVCCLLLLDSTLQGTGPAPVVGPFSAS
jgi:hypothetical protein